MLRFVVPFAVALFAIFPLTDTDIWWHLACSREWVTTWTPVRTPVVNVHEYFQQLMSFIYGLGGAPLLVAFKALLWGCVFALFLRKAPKNLFPIVLAIVAVFVFRYQFECRPIVLSLLFLGIYWNVVPWLMEGEAALCKKIPVAMGVLIIQWVWCKCQGLYILGPIYTAGVFLLCRKKHYPWGVLPLLMFCMPFLHGEGLLLFAYPFELLNRLLGLSSSATIFASEIAENRSPVTLLLAGENSFASFWMVALAVLTILFVGYEIRRIRHLDILRVTLLVTAVLALVAERNFVLFLPVFIGYMSDERSALPIRFFSGRRSRFRLKILSLVVLAVILGAWFRSLQAYDASMVSFRRVPVEAAKWMMQNPHEGRLFNDDRAGGYLAFVNPQDSVYIDGRFMLKTADFFKQYLHFADSPEDFIRYADSAGIDRAVFPLRYYARWDGLIKVLAKDSLTGRGKWRLAYSDDYFCVFDRAGK